VFGVGPARKPKVARMSVGLVLVAVAEAGLVIVVCLPPRLAKPATRPVVAAAA